jgi:quercetin dioxygenase-like cupin family protein|tara:strand:- start:1497 stop:1892 length:396 start_codon:yes stop_codon:yes gene_type:complete
MPFYKAQDMQATPDVVNPNVMMMQFGGEFIKVGIVTYEAGEAPPPHSHPNDEQWIYMLEGRLAHLLDDETVTVGPGDLVHIPRNTVHGIRLLESPCRFFTCKSPAGSGNLSEDYTEVPNVTELEQRLAEVS